MIVWNNKCLYNLNGQPCIIFRIKARFLLVCFLLLLCFIVLLLLLLLSVVSSCFVVSFLALYSYNPYVKEVNLHNSNSFAQLIAFFAKCILLRVFIIIVIIVVVYKINKQTTLSSHVRRMWSHSQIRLFGRSYPNEIWKSCCGCIKKKEGISSLFSVARLTIRFGASVGRNCLFYRQRSCHSTKKGLRRRRRSVKYLCQKQWKYCTD